MNNTNQMKFPSSSSINVNNNNTVNNTVFDNKKKQPLNKSIHNNIVFNVKDNNKDNINNVNINKSKKAHQHRQVIADAANYAADDDIGDDYEYGKLINKKNNHKKVNSNNEDILSVANLGMKYNCYTYIIFMHINIL